MFAWGGGFLICMCIIKGGKNNEDINIRTSAPKEKRKRQKFDITASVVYNFEIDIHTYLD
ncbi:hypothetical protein DT075_16030 [Bacillus licheniformis]|nr:hypothetical protein DT075_16030 [Bacillus licheniformis]